MDTISVTSDRAGQVTIQNSPLSWRAIIAGTIAAWAATIVLMALGTGLGLTAVSLWEGEGLSVASVGIMAIIWMVAVQWLSAALGGYLTGRLRTRWAGVDHDEVYFRDTAHGFLAWGLTTVIATVLATSMIAGAASSTARGFTALASGAAQGAAQGATASGGPMGYWVDSLFRTENPAQPPQAAQGQNNDPASMERARGETPRLLTMGLQSDMSAADRTYSWPIDRIADRHQRRRSAAAG